MKTLGRFKLLSFNSVDLYSVPVGKIHYSTPSCCKRLRPAGGVIAAKISNQKLNTGAVQIKKKSCTVIQHIQF